MNLLQVTWALFMAPRSDIQMGGYWTLLFYNTVTWPAYKMDKVDYTNTYRLHAFISNQIWENSSFTSAPPPVYMYIIYVPQILFYTRANFSLSISIVMGKYSVGCTNDFDITEPNDLKTHQINGQRDLMPFRRATGNIYHPKAGNVHQ